MVRKDLKFVAAVEPAVSVFVAVEYYGLHSSESCHRVHFQIDFQMS